jgi:hypothetical protein
VLKKEMEFEREFVKAGGLLLCGVDPTGWGGVVAGFGDQRSLELLVEAGGFLARGVDSHRHAEWGNVSRGEWPDWNTGAGQTGGHCNRSRESVFKHRRHSERPTYIKDGVGSDTAKLIESVRGMVGAE